MYLNVFKVSKYNASVTNGIFKSLAEYSHARAPDVMSTQSAVGFEWTIKLIGKSRTTSFYVGIASMIKPEASKIYSYDQNSVLYSTAYNDIRVGSTPLYSNLTQHKDGDVIRFRFQPQTKKLLIDLVRVNLHFQRIIFKLRTGIMKSI